MQTRATSTGEEKQYCNVCSLSEVGHIVSSGLAPVSGGLCDECFSRGAENLGVIHLWIFHLGGLQNTPEWASKLVSCQNGAYVGWDEISEAYRRNEEAIKAEFAREFEALDRGELELVDDDPADETLDDSDD